MVGGAGCGQADEQTCIVLFSHCAKWKPSDKIHIIILDIQPSAQAYCYKVGKGERVERGTGRFQEYSRKEFNQRSTLNTESMTEGGQNKVVDYH